MARTSPLLTVCPTLTDTVFTGQTRVPLPELLDPVLLLTEPPVPEVVLAELTMSGLTPNLRP